MGEVRKTKKPQATPTRRQRYATAAREFDDRTDREFPWYRQLHGPIGLVEMNKVFIVGAAVKEAEMKEARLRGTRSGKKLRQNNPAPEALSVRKERKYAVHVGDIQNG